MACERSPINTTYYRGVSGGIVLMLVLSVTYYARATVVCTPLGALTTNFSLCKPVTGELSWAAAIDNNFDVLDALFPSQILAAANGGTGATTYTPSYVVYVAGMYGNTANAPTGQFFGVSGEIMQGVVFDTSTATEADTKLVVTTACTASNLSIITASGNGGTATVQLRKNGVDTALSVAVGAAASTVYSDLSHTVSLAVGDKINYSQTGARTAAMTSVVMKCA